MNLYLPIRQLLFLLPPETAHLVVKNCLRLYALIKPQQPSVSKQNNIEIDGIQFKNLIGIAAGFDKEAKYVAATESLNPGFVEAGSFTPKPQAGNDKPRLLRLPKEKCLINRMGLNNVGIDKALENLSAQKYTIPVGISLCKNNHTKQDNAIDDYRYGMEKFIHKADYFAINISCPNVPDFEKFWQGNFLKSLLLQLKEAQNQNEKKFGRHVPIYIKISPDLSDDVLEKFCEHFNAADLEGVIACNTSFWRPDTLKKQDNYQQKGGLSGPLIYPRMLKSIRVLRHFLKAQKTIIALGGIDSEEKALECLAAGADLLQVYTSLIYEGPGLIKKLAKLKPKRKAH